MTIAKVSYISQEFIPQIAALSVFNEDIKNLNLSTLNYRCISKDFILNY